MFLLRSCPGAHICVILAQEYSRRRLHLVFVDGNGVLLHVLAVYAECKPTIHPRSQPATTVPLAAYFTGTSAGLRVNKSRHWDAPPILRVQFACTSSFPLSVNR